MNCQNCDFTLAAGTTFCPNCGNPIEMSEPPPPAVAPPRDSSEPDSPDGGDRAEGQGDNDLPATSDSATLPPAATAYQPNLATASLHIPNPAQTPYPTDASGAYYQPPPEGSHITQAQAPANDSFVVGAGPSTTGTWLFPLIALILGILIGAIGAYLVIPSTEYIAVPDVGPSPEPTTRVAGVLPLPDIPGKPGPLVPPGPDEAAQRDLRNALIAQKRYYVDNRHYTVDTGVLQQYSGDVTWEPGQTPSRPGVVAVNMCGPEDDASTAVLLQSIGTTGSTYALLDVPTGPAAGVYYGRSNAAFSCPDTAPPPSPWMRGIAGWGVTQPTVAPSPTPQIQLPPESPIIVQPRPSPSPTPTGFDRGTNPFPTKPDA